MPRELSKHILSHALLNFAMTDMELSHALLNIAMTDMEPSVGNTMSCFGDDPIQVCIYDLVFSPQLMVRTEIEIFVWWEDLTTGRVEWRSGTEPGELSVTISGVPLTPTSFASNSNTRTAVHT